MKIHEFFPKLKREIQKIVFPGKGKLFNNGVYICTAIPVMQLATITTPFCVIIDYGSSPHTSHPNVQHQTFGVFTWVDCIFDQFGEATITEIHTIEHTLQAFITNSIAIDGKKVSILAIKKNAISLTIHNAPCSARGWIYSVLLEI